MITLTRLAGTSLLMTAVLASGSASANPPRSVEGTAGNFLATVTVDARNTGVGTAATGTFTSTGALLPGSTFGGLPSSITGLGAFSFTGPVTCLDIEGNRAGLIYPITSASGPLAQNAVGQAIYVTIVDNGPGRPTDLGFAGPAPIGNLTVCPPTVTFTSSNTGRIKVTP